MKLLELVALPPFVVTAIVPVVAPVGTVAVIFESEFTVNEADTTSGRSVVFGEVGEWGCRRIRRSIRCTRGLRRSA